MYKKLLAKFFKENNYIQPDSLSVADIAYYLMVAYAREDIDTELREKVAEMVFSGDPERKVLIEEERLRISELKNAEGALQFMRKAKYSMNQNILCDKALEFEIELVPLLLNKLKKSLHVQFIETVCLYFTKCENSDQNLFKEAYYEIGDPYAKAQLLLSFGFIADEKEIPWMIKQHNILYKEDEGDGLQSLPYYGLMEMEDRFYPTK